MSKSLTISDELYEPLEKSALQLGIADVEGLLELWHHEWEERRKRFKAVERIKALRKKIVASCGKMPDSADLIREDRLR